MGVKSLTSKTDIFFDLDHTLWDFEKNSALAFNDVIEELKLPFSTEAFLSHYVAINNEYWDKYSLNQVSKEELRIGRIRDTFAKLGYQSTTEEMLLLGDNYLKAMPNHNYLFDGAIEVLDYLQDKYKLHIITNGFNEVQGKKLDRSGISGYFQTVTNSEMAGVSKPNPEIFNYALDKAKAGVKDSVMIGDNFLADIEGALGVGMDAIYYSQSKEKVTPQIYHVQKLIELKDLL
ncbi:noncanonical pyrimidine nucleotidase, YjjG family [Myroides odoratimimus]|uniref:Haloacid dehalogenase n=3 Tax=Myroides odoratimimus TaxID=76832 RepID=A0A0S7EKH7_9FLAO|nr:MULTISPECIES: YjjG family noncanonical pyrimidine nucleotidase [Myroides]AJA67802.1 noncanonical pyrimidine nucleotidase, YjjG family [Myroides sp. A21]ALU25087.1 haloacid dehalogenase [Myroides odoratimimus]APA91126.1 noncanonical pyrimidine nucleotidase, YjjG family [Myroides sp. ZB35]EHO04992.1 TIGR02254 family HAD hydrolase [Myroides odoratimimus CIP 101113]EHO05718.1 TIGR02254 family HAD hydrolase [Myroides odoratimimus CCUG 12901]